MLLLEDKVMKFMNYCKENALWFDEEDDYVDDDKIYEAAEYVYGKDNYETAHGVTKYVVVPNEGDYVLKFPFNGILFQVFEEYDSELHDFVSLEDIQKDFDDFGTDYCAIEVNVYEKAKEQNLDKLFAKVECCGECYGGISCYKQEKINIFGDNVSQDTSSDSYKKASTMISGYSSCKKLQNNIGWLSSVIDMYGEVMAQALIDFCEENYVNDLHGNNIGYRDNGEPVLVDYSGYFN